MKTAWTICALQEGGYFAQEQPLVERGFYVQPSFASRNIDEVLNFIKAKIQQSENAPTAE